MGQKSSRIFSHLFLYLGPDFFTSMKATQYRDVHETKGLGV